MTSSALTIPLFSVFRSCLVDEELTAATGYLTRMRNKQSVGRKQVPKHAMHNNWRESENETTSNDYNTLSSTKHPEII